MKLIDIFLIAIIRLVVFIAFQRLYKSRKSPCLGCSRCDTIKKDITKIKDELQNKTT